MQDRYAARRKEMLISLRIAGRQENQKRHECVENVERGDDECQKNNAPRFR
jgi:hypothetical protein